MNKERLKDNPMKIKSSSILGKLYKIFIEKY